uniref:Uncharacterized protein n=1 Tax=Lepeophtheirus salmonis TaxID=72036 RepID=A0A0K2VHC7_LEPSM
MFKLLPSLRLAELHDACVKIELVESVEEIEGKKNVELTAIIRNHLSKYGCDHKDFDFATSGPTLPCTKDKELSPTTAGY